MLLDSVAIMDRLMRDAAVPLSKGEPLTADQLDRLLDATKMANHVAKVAVDAGAVAALVRERERHRDAEGQLLAVAVAAAVDGLTDHLVTLGIDYGHALTLRTWMLTAAAAKLEGGDVPALPPVPSEAVRVLKHDPGDDHDQDARDRDEDVRHDDDVPAPYVPDDQDEDREQADGGEHRDDDRGEVVRGVRGVRGEDELPPEVRDRPGVAELVTYRRARGGDRN